MNAEDAMFLRDCSMVCIGFFLGYAACLLAVVALGTRPARRRVYVERRPPEQLTLEQET